MATSHRPAPGVSLGFVPVPPGYPPPEGDDVLHAERALPRTAPASPVLAHVGEPTHDERRDAPPSAAPRAPPIAAEPADHSESAEPLLVAPSAASDAPTELPKLERHLSLGAVDVVVRDERDCDAGQRSSAGWWGVAAPPLSAIEVTPTQPSEPSVDRRVPARQRLRAAIDTVRTFAPISTSHAAQRDHWRPLQLRFVSDTEAHYHALPKHDGTGPAGAAGVVGVAGVAGAAGAPAGRARRAPPMSTGALENLRGSVRGGLQRAWSSYSSNVQRAEVRLLKTADARVRVPDKIGEWLVQPRNCAVDPRNERGQKILYVGKISVRFKDHILSQSPCAYALACPFPFMICLYFYDLWRVYTCAGCPAGVRSFDQPMLWQRKAYDERSYFHVYSNRIETNQPVVRCPWGVLGCGSWNADNVQVHYFDRGSFGFRRVPCATQYHCCCVWEPFGEVVGRQRCPCNGPLVDTRGALNCNQWWCDHWLCSTCCCHYHYPGLVDAEEASVAADVALQAYFDGGGTLEQEDFDARLEAELAKRHRRKRRQFPAGKGRPFDADRHSYSRTMGLIAVGVGLVTIALQIFLAIALALYIQYRSHRQWYIDAAAMYSSPEHYEQIFKNTTRAIDSFVPGSNATVPGAQGA